MRVGKIGRVLVWIVGVLIAVPAVAVGYALVRYDRVRDAPLPDVHAVSDPAVIARGRYLVYGPARCADCHSPEATRPQLFKGEEVPLTGGPGEHTYIGTWSAPNLTPDPVTGIGRMTDAEFARMLRYGVNRRGRIAPPFMDSYANLAQDDLVAILSYLRSIPARPGTPPDAQINLLGKITLAYFLDSYAPDATPPAHVEPEATAAYGGYIANTLGGCRTCHTARNLETGAYTSPPFSGGLPFRSRLHPGEVYVSPNLTPDPETGHITEWPEAGFVARFRAGLLLPDSPMPWGSFRRMTDDDLRAVYRYLQSLAPVSHDVGPLLQAEHGQAAG